MTRQIVVGLGESPTSLKEDKGRDCSTTGSLKDVEGFEYGFVLLLPHGLDHRITPDIGSIGYGIASGGVHQVKTLLEEMDSRCALGTCVGNVAWPTTPLK